MSNQDDIMNIINLLAGAAQSGAQGALSQAAFNLVKAIEAKQKASQLKNAEEMKQRADALVETTRDVFLDLANDPAALAQGKEDIIATGGKPYSR